MPNYSVVFKLAFVEDTKSSMSFSLYTSEHTKDTMINISYKGDAHRLINSIGDVLYIRNSLLRMLNDLFDGDILNALEFDLDNNFFINSIG